MMRCLLTAMINAERWGAMLRENKVKQRILNGEKLVGAFLNLESPAVAEILGLLGYDFILIDTEHGPGDAESAQDIIRAALLRDITPMVRVRQLDRSSILKMLEVGAEGLLIPFVKSAAEVRQIVQYAKYAPIGEKGFGYSRKTGYGLEKGTEDMEAFFAWSNENTLVIPQCETVQCLEHIEEIAAIDGVDGVFVGPFDLSVSMGIPGQTDHPDFIAATERIVEACKQAGKFSMVFSMLPEQAKKYFDAGFDGIAASDVRFIADGAGSLIKGIKEFSC